jgi:TIR domain
MGLAGISSAGTTVRDHLFIRTRWLTRWLMPSPSAAVDPLGPVFVCYRTLDGAAKARYLAWTLRATGLPVWHDTTDLLPGDTPHRLTQALEGGLSGAVVVVTPDITHSHVVRGLELPRLLELALHVPVASDWTTSRRLGAVTRGRGSGLEVAEAPAPE